MKKFYFLSFMVAIAFTACGGGAKKLSTKEAFDMLAQHRDMTIIDVRTPEEFRQGHIDGALNLDVQSHDFASRLSEIPSEVRGSRVFIYCRSGRRSSVAARIMKSVGFTDLVELEAGIISWVEEGYPITVSE